jgi:predicted nucleic acid-binding protein
MEMRMKKLRLYLDTSTISHLDQKDAHEKMTDTHMLWKEIEAGVYDVAISTITERELKACPEQKRLKLLSYMGRISYNVIPISEEIISIADTLIEFKVLSPSSIDDCQHIAAAIVGRCDVIVSWNFKHIVNYKTIQGVKAVTAITGFPEVLIYTPTILIGGVSNDT